MKESIMLLPWSSCREGGGRRAAQLAVVAVVAVQGGRRAAQLAVVAVVAVQEGGERRSLRQVCHDVLHNETKTN